MCQLPPPQLKPILLMKIIFSQSILKLCDSSSFVGMLISCCRCNLNRICLLGVILIASVF
jgi:hypothetical protein